MIKQQININGVPTMVLQSELTRKILGQDEEGNDILGDFYKNYNEDMTINTAKEEAEAKAEAVAKADIAKSEALQRLIITISTGKRFYADPESRTDLLTAVIEIIEQGLFDDYQIDWKTPDGIMKVSALEMKEAKRLALEAKAGIIGV